MWRENNSNDTDDQTTGSSGPGAQASAANGAAEKSARTDDNRRAAEPSVLNYDPSDYTDDRGTTSGQTLPVQNGAVKDSDTKLPA